MPCCERSRLHSESLINSYPTWDLRGLSVRCSATIILAGDIKTVTTPGVCTIDDESGCTLADVIADINATDAFTVDIPIHFTGDEYPEDGLVTNAELLQRGGFTRLAPQKSFRIKLDSKTVLWRNERRLQLNKMPYDTSRMRNKLSIYR